MMWNFWKEACLNKHHSLIFCNWWILIFPILNFKVNGKVSINCNVQLTIKRKFYQIGSREIHIFSYILRNNLRRGFNNVPCAIWFNWEYMFIKIILLSWSLHLFHYHSEQFEKQRIMIFTMYFVQKKTIIFAKSITSNLKIVRKNCFEQSHKNIIYYEIQLQIFLPSNKELFFNLYLPIKY